MCLELKKNKQKQDNQKKKKKKHIQRHDTTIYENQQAIAEGTALNDSSINILTTLHLNTRIYVR